MAKVKKTPRPKAETPKGFRDYFGAEVTQRAEMLGKIAEVYHRYGFDALETSAVETVEALGKFLPDVDRPNEGVFAWEEDADWLALRYDMTAPLARVYAQYRNDLPTPYRRYAMGPVWRNEKPGPGRFRQFYQCDADTVGAPSVAADAEICAMLADTLEAVGIERGDYIIRVNNRKVLNGLLEGMAVANPKVPLPRTTDELLESRPSDWEFVDPNDVLRTIDKYDKVGREGVLQLLTVGREDDSGAFIKGLGLSDEKASKIIAFVEARQDKQASMTGVSFASPSSWFSDADFEGEDGKFHRRLQELRIASENLEARDDQYLLNSGTLIRLWEVVKDSEVGREGVLELLAMATQLTGLGYGPDRIVIDPSVVRGLGYYTGPVYEAELTFEIKDEKGRPRSFGSVAGGGRYDDLVKRFTGQEVPATGVSIGVDRLLAALQMKGRMQAEVAGPVVVTVMDRDRMADYQAMVAELRSAGIRAEVYLGNPKNFGNQMKYADKRNAPIAIIQGGDEHAAGMVQIKDLILGAKIAETATLEEWKDRPSQVEVPRDQMVAKVREMLAGQAAG